MNLALLNILMSWAVMLSPYSTPDVLPEIQYKPKSFFVESACKGNTKCDIWGWYNDNGIVYLIDWMDVEDNNMIINSYLVHELVHYLQDINDNGGTSCENINRREREAYYIQRKFLVQNGILPAISTKQHWCK